MNERERWGRPPRLAEVSWSWPATIPIGEAIARRRCCCEAPVVEVVSVQAPPCFTAVVAEHERRIALVFLGRSEVPGIAAGVRLRFEGMLAGREGSLRILNPRYVFAER